MDISGVLKSLKGGKNITVAIDELTPNPLQPRRVFDEDELYSLAESIKNYGLIQPIAVKKLIPLPHPMPKIEAKYEIIAGERRWRAAKIAGLTEIHCIVFDADRQDSAMMALIENLQRSNLSYFEEALAMQTLLLMSGKTQSELARALSISQSTLSNKLRLLRLSERERLMAIENGFSERHCRALLRIESERERRSVMLAIIKNELQAPDTERLVDEYLSEKIVLPEKQRERKKNPHIKGAIGDMRFLYNTIDKTVKMLHSSGYIANWSKNEADGTLEVKITVKKEGI